MAFSSALTEKAAAMRKDFEALIAKENPSPEDIKAASKLDAELAEIETRMNEAIRLEQQAEARRKADEQKAEAKRQADEQEAEARRKAEKTPLRLINTGGSDGAAEKPWEPASKSWFDHLLESPEFKSALETRDFRKVHVELPQEAPLVPGRVGYKAAGDPIMSSQFATRSTDLTIVPHVFAPIGVIDLINVVNVTAANIRYYQPGTFTNAADFIVEGALKPEVQPRWTPVDVPIETIADWTAVTLQALDDVPQLRSAIDFDLRSAIEAKVDNAILNGSGTSPQIRGILNTVGIQTVAFVATTSAPDMILKGIAAVGASGQGVPTGIVMNPADAWAMRALKATGSGVYYFGAPSDAGTTNLFGIRVVPDPNIAAGTALVGDFRMATIYQRLGITFIVGLKNDDLIKNLQTIVCEERLTLAVRRPAAFAKVALV